MFARTVSMQLKPNTLVTEFSKTLETGVLPLLRKQTGFREEIAFNGDNNRVTAISLWDSKEAAEAYENGAYPQVVKLLEGFIEGTPKVRTSDVIHSTTTALKTAASATAAPASAGANAKIA